MCMSFSRLLRMTNAAGVNRDWEDLCLDLEWFRSLHACFASPQPDFSLCPKAILCHQPTVQTTSTCCDSKILVHSEIVIEQKIQVPAYLVLRSKVMQRHGSRESSCLSELTIPTSVNFFVMLKKTNVIVKKTKSHLLCYKINGNCILNSNYIHCREHTASGTSFGVLESYKIPTTKLYNSSPPSIFSGKDHIVSRIRLVVKTFIL